MTEEELLYEIEQTIDDAIDDNYPHDWYEDQITRDILKGLRKRVGAITNIEGRSNWTNRHMSWSAYKQIGAHETRWGDIAVLVNIVFKDGTRVEGVGFAEAKKRSIGRSSFDAIRKKQLQTIARNAPIAQLLLYDYEPSTAAEGKIDPTYFIDYPFEILRGAKLVYNSRAICTPLATALASNVKTRDQMQNSVPFSWELVYRYLRGFDLHHHRNVIAAIHGTVESKNLPKFLLAVTVRYDGDTPSGIDLNPNTWEIIED